MNLIDTHCHINFDSYDADRDAIITRAAEAGVQRIINPSVDLETSRAVVDLSKQYSGVYGAVGIHPNSTADFETAWIDEIATLAGASKIVAIGEIAFVLVRQLNDAEVPAVDADERHGEPPAQRRVRLSRLAEPVPVDARPDTRGVGRVA